MCGGLAALALEDGSVACIQRPCGSHMNQCRDVRELVWDRSDGDMGPSAALDSAPSAASCKFGVVLRAWSCLVLAWCCLIILIMLLICVPGPADP